MVVTLIMIKKYYYLLTIREACWEISWTNTTRTSVQRRNTTQKRKDGSGALSTIEWVPSSQSVVKSV